MADEFTGSRQQVREYLEAEGISRDNAEAALKSAAEGGTAFCASAAGKVYAAFSVTSPEPGRFRAHRFGSRVRHGR